MLGKASRARQVRCTTKKLVQISALPPKAKITADVCSGRNRPKVVYSNPRFSTGYASCKAMKSPASRPTTPQKVVAITPQRTGASS